MSRFSADDIAALDGIWNQRSIENPSVPISSANLDAFVGLGMISAGPTPAGVRVNAETAIRHWLVFACIRVIAETIASLPLQVMRRTSNGVEKAREHPLWTVLHDRPNGMLTSYAFREALVGMSCLYGRAYAVIVGQQSMLLTPTNAVTPRVTRAGLVYDIRYADGSEEVSASQIIQLPGLTLDGVSGISVVLTAARDIIGEAMATGEHSSRFFSNGARVGGVLTTDQVLKDDAVARLKAQWNAMQGGLANAYKTAVLEQGLKYQAVAMQSDHAQLVETRRMLTEQIAGAFRVPPMFIGDYTRMTYSNAEQNDLHFTKHCITPWIVKLEQELNSKFFADDPEHYCAFNLRGLLRGDFKTQIDSLARGIQSAIYTPNEARELLELPPKEGGDKLYIQQNMSATDALPEPTNEPPPEAQE